MKEMSASFLDECADTFAEIVFGEATVKAFTLGNQSRCHIDLRVIHGRLDATSNGAGE